MRVGLTSYDTKLFVNYSVIINYYLLISFFEKKMSDIMYSLDIKVLEVLYVSNG